jgi:hypothetical protein
VLHPLIAGPDNRFLVPLGCLRILLQAHQANRGFSHLDDVIYDAQLWNLSPRYFYLLEIKTLKSGYKMKEAATDKRDSAKDLYWQELGEAGNGRLVQ